MFWLEYLVIYNPILTPRIRGGKNGNILIRRNVFYFLHFTNRSLVHIQRGIIAHAATSRR